LEQKKTCLWLKNLPKLKETNNVYEEMMKLAIRERAKIWYMGSNHSKERSKTYPGIAQAIAQQWSDYLTGNTDIQLTLF
jgi:hydroxyacyl-ACP dehydratase HTD2-like protein with hotdog domain